MKENKIHKEIERVLKECKEMEERLAKVDGHVLTNPDLHTVTENNQFLLEKHIGDMLDTFHLWSARAKHSMLEANIQIIKNHNIDV